MCTVENLTELIASEIKKQFKSVRKFAMHMDIPQTTLFSILKNGVAGTSFETVVKICRELGIEFVNYSSAVKLDGEILDIVEKYNFLDNYGAHTVKAIVNAEFERCSKSPSFIRLASMGKSSPGEDNSNASDVRIALSNAREKE